MHFYKQAGNVMLDLKGDLVLSHRKDWPTYGTKSALPHRIHGGHIIRWSGVRGRLRATWRALAFIWGGSAA